MITFPNLPSVSVERHTWTLVFSSLPLKHKAPGGEGSENGEGTVAGSQRTP